MRNTRFYTIDLVQAEGEGNVSCPKCGAEISPEDDSEETYTVLKPIMRKDSLERIMLQCNKCGSKICLIGFKELNSRN